MNSRPSLKPSMYSEIQVVLGSSSRKSMMSAKLTSDMLPMENILSKPTRRVKLAASNAMSSAPDWEIRADLPGRGRKGAKEALS